RPPGKDGAGIMNGKRKDSNDEEPQAGLVRGPTRPSKGVAGSSPFQLALVLVAALSTACAEPPPGSGGAERLGVGDAGPREQASPTPPATFGLDSAYLAVTLERAEGLPRLRCLLIARHGKTQVERCFRGPGP